MRRTVAVLAVLGLASTAAMATPYASGITDLGGGMYSFILNQDASSVVIDRWGDSSLDLGALTRGTYSFSVGSGTGFDIAVGSSAAAGWSQYIPDDTLTSFYSPCGVSINTNPASPNFGKVYISETQTATTGFGRSVTSGIYMLNADASDAGWADGGVDWTAAGTSSPFKSTIGPDGCLYVADYSNDLAYGFSADMSVATQLIDASNKTAGQYVECIWVEGTQAGGDRAIYLVDSHYLDGRRGLIRYDLGAGDTAAPSDVGTQWIGPDYFGFYPRDVARDSSGDWYMNQYRYSPDQAPALTKFDGAGTIPLGDDPAEVLWESDISQYTGAYCLAINEDAGIIAYGHYYTGEVFIFDMATGAFIESFDAGSRIRELAFDAAGNLVTGDNSIEWVRFWSPGGDWLATTSSDGTFTLIPEPASLMLLALGGLALLRRR
jgi:MYXO-CTERM domain-containing protein